MQSTALRNAPFDPDVLEDQRLQALERLDVLDTPREEGFDAIAQLVRAIFGVRVGLVSLLDAHRQWCKSCDGLNLTEVPRQDTFCNQAIRQIRPLVIPDTRADPRFAEHMPVAGTPHVRFYAGAPLRTRDGHNVGTLCAMDFEPREFGQHQVEILADLARVTMNQLELRRLVTVDALTGALSRRAFQDEAARAIALGRRHEMDVSCVSFDLDNFKQINDRYGHQAGDMVLSAVSARCRALLRRTDQFGRVGGEEFAAVLPHTDARGAMDAAEKLRQAIEALTVDIGLATIRVTASFGVSTLEAEADDLDALMAHADAALHQAKAGGRNRCVAWKPSGEAERSLRRRVLKAGTIVFNDRSATVDCTVRTLADDGAGIDLSSALAVPDSFALVLRAERSEVACRVLSRSARHVEVAFV